MVLDPWYIFIYLIVILIIYSLCFVKTTEMYKFNYIGKILLVISILSCVVLTIYVIHAAYVQDTESMIFDSIGILHVMLFTHPYLFLTFSILIGSTGKKQ